MCENPWLRDADKIFWGDAPQVEYLCSGCGYELDDMKMDWCADCLHETAHDMLSEQRDREMNNRRKQAMIYAMRRLIE